MKIKQAEKSIGKVVSFLPSTKPYTNSSYGASLNLLNDETIKCGYIRSFIDGDLSVIARSKKGEIVEIYIDPKHVELKSDMEAIKIRLYSSHPFKAVIKKLLKMGYHLENNAPRFAQYIYTKSDGRILFDYFASTDEPCLSWSNDHEPDAPLNYFNNHIAKEVLVGDLLFKKN